MYFWTGSTEFPNKILIHQVPNINYVLQFKSQLFNTY